MQFFEFNISVYPPSPAWKKSSYLIKLMSMHIKTFRDLITESQFNLIFGGEKFILFLIILAHRRINESSLTAATGCGLVSATVVPANRQHPGSIATASGSARWPHSSSPR